MSTPQAPAVTPLAQSERIDSLDVLRGFALLGILLMNIQLFAMPNSAFVNPTSYGDFTGANYAVWFFSRLFADQKFMTIFSMLFGAGVIVFSTRAENRGGSPARLHYSRSLWLLVFGLLHAYLLWPGDILVSYAVCALFVYLFRKLSPTALLVSGLAIIGVGSAVMFAASLAMPHWSPEEVAQWKAYSQPPPEDVAKELMAYRGGWTEQQPYRTAASVEAHVFDLWTWAVWRAGGLMLVGMALYRWGVFSAVRSRAFYKKMIALGLLFGVPIVYWGIRVNEAREWDPLFIQLGGEQFNYWGSLAISAAYVGVVMLFCQSGVGAGVKHAFRCIGQMAFTNYLTHSFICTTIFYGHGLGYFGHFSRVEQLLTVLGVWFAQLIYSPLWLTHFRYGPFEWLWRSLTYWKAQPMLRRS